MKRDIAPALVEKLHDAATMARLLVRFFDGAADGEYDGTALRHVVRILCTELRSAASTVPGSPEVEALDEAERAAEIAERMRGSYLGQFDRESFVYVCSEAAPRDGRVVEAAAAVAMLEAMGLDAIARAIVDELPPLHVRVVVASHDGTRLLRLAATPSSPGGSA